SEYSKADILEKVPGCGDKIAVINNGLNDVAFGQMETAGDAKGSEQAKDRRNDYMAAMTSGLPHKNAKGVLAAYETYYKLVKDKQIKDKNEKEPLDLVVFGLSDTSLYPKMDKEAAAHVRCYKFFEKFEDMCRMAAGAKAYLFLSYVEGFGFPPLEAMQLGVPVVCSNRSSLPEVVADAGILVEPDDDETIAQALIQVTTNEELRKELIQ
ncbi:MAG: glycosyltransferase, partial [Lachnospiraceae bacterium]|nr:glycosyltransferase [Lachnospiraceae bacterium]